MKAKEILKDIILVLLIIGAGALTWSNWMYDERLLDSPALSWLGLNRQLDTTYTAVIKYSEASTPLRAAVIKDGHRLGAQYDAAAVSDIFARAKPALGDALGSASGSAAVDENKWRALLSQDGIYLAFPAPVPLSALAAWCGTELNAQLSDKDVSSVILCRNDDKTEFCFSCSDGYYMSSTAVQYSMLESSTNSVSAAGCSFAYELGESFKSISPYTLIIGEPLSAPILSTSSSLDSSDKTLAILKGLGLNPLTNRYYEETDETKVYVEGGCTLRILKDGSVLYRNSDTSGGENSLLVESSGGGVKKSEMIEAIRLIISKTAAAFSGDAELYFSSIEEKDGETIVSYNYIVNGIPVFLSDSNYAVQAAIKDGVITRINFRLRSYSIDSGDKLQVLPEKQAAAALGTLSKDKKELILSYLDNGSEELYASWMGK